MARKSSKHKVKIDLNDLESIKDNVIAISKGPKRKNWSVLDLKSIKPLTEPQRQMIESYLNGNHIAAMGTAGTGKSFVALWLALNSVFSKDEPQSRLIIVRSIETTGRDIGRIPGEIYEKIAPFEAPYKDIINFLMQKPHAYDDLKEAGKIEFIPSTFIRGITLDYSIIFIDENQNHTLDDFSSCCTRVGENSRLIVAGDGKQTDLTRSKHITSGYYDALKILEAMPSVDVIYFGVNDIVRSGLVKEFILAKEELNL